MSNEQRDQQSTAEQQAPGKAQKAEPTRSDVPSAGTQPVTATAGPDFAGAPGTPGGSLAGGDPSSGSTPPVDNRGGASSA